MPVPHKTLFLQYYIII